MRCAYQAYKVVQYTEFTSFGRPDKAFTPHPAPEHHCLLLKIGVGRRPISANLRVEPSEECDASVPR